MNWRTEAIQRLGNYTGQQTARQNLTQEISRLEALLRSPGKAWPDRIGKGTHSREDWQLDQLVTLEQLRFQKDRVAQWLAVTDRALATLTEQERLILDRLWIHPAKGNMDRLIQELHLERSGIYRHRDKALERFTLALYGA